MPILFAIALDLPGRPFGFGREWDSKGIEDSQAATQWRRKSESLIGILRSDEAKTALDASEESV
jgi:hypothetical protein